jgi:hypothetical protein
VAILAILSVTMPSARRSQPSRSGAARRP